MLIQGDSSTVLKTLDAESVDLVLTSPPYDNLRSYISGADFDFYSIAANLVRVLKPGGVIVWVVADATVKGSETGTSFRQALHFMGLGLKLHDTMIYQKSNYAPKTHRRYEQAFEYMFVFSKGVPRTFNGLLKPNVVQPDRKVGGTHTQPDGPRKIMSAPRRTHSLLTNVWRMAPETRSRHPAPFPMPLARDHILTWTEPGDTVLDPFLGSGTTALAAAQLDRRYIGIEREAEYVKLAQERLGLEDAGDITIFNNEAGCDPATAQP